ncbi:stalk domain-containing protein [Paenibacillus beijingensis]
MEILLGIFTQHDDMSYGTQVLFQNGVIIRDNQAFIPLRSVFEQLGAKLTWDSAGKIVTLERTTAGGAILTITINYKTSVNTEAVD